MKAGKITKLVSKMATNLMKKTSKARLKTIKYAPDILKVAGAIGVGVGTVMVGVASTKVNDILEEHHDAIESTPADISTIKVYADTAIKVVKLYAAPVAVTGVSLASILFSNHILKKRFLGVSAAYAALQGNFSDYRQRVSEKYGDSAEKDILIDAETNELDTGSEVTYRGTGTDSELGAYQYWFNKETSYAYEDDPTFWRIVLSAKQSVLNNRLQIKGWMSLNDALSELEFHPNYLTKQGQVVGWVYRPEGNPDGDNYIHIEAQEVMIPQVDGSHKIGVLLNFNVDGVILDKI